MRIGLVASSGGHLTQLLKLKDSWKGHEVFCVTTTEVVRERLQREGPVYVVGECNRQHPLRTVCVLCRCVGIVLREKADVIISTGAAAGCMVCFLGKCRGAKVVWMDSITNVKRLSLSGRLIRPFADLFLVQWPELATKYKGAEYVGAVI